MHDQNAQITGRGNEPQGLLSSAWLSIQDRASSESYREKGNYIHQQKQENQLNRSKTTKINTISWLS